MNNATLHKAFLIGIAALLAGCAVLTVDVDVYKGPLANHKDIQTEQMAAMAIGAKPLLIELRDTLEVEHEYWKNFKKEEKKKFFLLKLFKSKDLDKRLSYLRESTWYRPEYIVPDPNEKNMKKSRFRSSDADNVNNILYMYEDRRPEAYDKLFEILSRYKKNYEILRPNDMAEDEALAKDFRKMEKSDPNASKLLNAYENYLGDNRRNALKVLQETFAYLKTTKPKSSLLIELKSKEESDENALQNVTNAAQRFLAETNLVDDCVDEIFGLKGKLREQFVTRVKEIAKSYLHCRSALEDLWLWTVEQICVVNISSLPVGYDDEHEHRKKTMAETTTLVDLSLDIIQPRYLAVLLDAANEKTIPKNIKDLAVSLGPYPPADPNISNNQWDFERMKWCLGIKLRKEPIKTVAALKAIHEFCKSDLDPEKASIKQYVGKGDLGSLAYKEGWKFGLARAPFDGLEPEDLEEKTKGFGGGAFAKGRLDDGLETLIEKYLKQADVCDPNDKELCWTRKRLSDALVRFAEKLLFVANNRSLISPPKGQGLIIETIDVLSRGLLGEGITGGATDYFGLSEGGTSQYTRILQAVGNSIVVQADALHQEEIHANGLKRRSDTEVAVLRHTLGLSAENVIDRLIQALEAEQSSKQHQAEKTVSASADAIKQLEELEKKVKALSDETEPDKQAVAQATKEKQDQQRCVDSLKKSAEDARIESKKTADTIAEIRDVKFAVLEKVEEMDSYASAGTVYGLVHSTLQEKLEKQESAGADNEKIKSLKNAVEDMNDRPLPMDLKLSDSMLPENPSAKDIRDVWITLMEYEHDLALRNGDKHRAEQIKEAIKAARNKREGMIFIRPAMAYLRTSFPATSLQSNPNLTWDNMLGGQMLRSIPFAPQIGEFLNPDAKRDARITAEIDKQFWQNINRVRVAGGGNTNYAVVKDDIGNWYVKGYSANPEDIIQSAQNLALFSAAGKMGTPSLVPSALATEPNQVRATPGSTLESMLSKYEEDYREETEQGYVLLCEIMQDPNTNIRDQIKELWKTNGNAKEKQPELEAALKWSYTQFLETYDPNDKKYKEDISKQRELIIEGIKRLKQFRNDLIWKITNVYRQNGESTGSDASGEVAAKSIVKNVVDGRIKDLLANRKDAIKTYENALMFLAEATQPQEK